ncbi:porin [Methylotenera sp.]|jgi:hypothetical protein|uniref:porin n=1 Tax=Methylotenera sp. TaxID=2051956 RepID=UPI00351D621B
MELNLNLKKTALLSLAFVGASMATVNANAAATITFGEDKSLSVGFGFISSYSSVEDAAGNGKDRSNDFSLDSARLYLSGSLNKYIKGMLNTEKSNGQSWEVIDANVQFEVTPELAIWAGRFLSPSDRANMAGPYYSMGGGYWSNIASRYGWNGGIIGRDEGVAVVGNALDGKLAYSFGAFEGDNIFRFSGVGALSETAGTKDKLMYAGRLQYDFWDAEPGYYGTGNYFGAKDILAIGVAGRSKKDGVVSTTGAVGDYTSYSVDFLLEKKNVGDGTASFEAAYYDYDTDKVFLGEEGKAYSVGAGYLFNQPVGWGKFMPFVRYQKFAADGATSSASVNTVGDIDTKKFEIGMNYVMQPYNAVITAAYGDKKVTNQSSVNSLNVSLQMQF